MQKNVSEDFVLLLQTTTSTLPYNLQPLIGMKLSGHILQFYKTNYSVPNNFFYIHTLPLIFHLVLFQFPLFFQVANFFIKAGVILFDNRFSCIHYC